MGMTLKQHDTAPAVSITCTDNGAPVDLTGATTVKVIGKRGSTALFTRTVSGSDVGVVGMPWQTVDTAAAGVILLEVEVTWPDGSIQTFPADGYLTVEVLPDLG